MFLSHQMLLITVKKYMLHVYQFSGPGSTTSGGAAGSEFFFVVIRILLYSLEAVELTKIIGKTNSFRKNVFAESFFNPQKTG